MSPKEKAEELIEKFSKSTLIFYDRVGLSEVKYEARRCALIAVDEIIIQNNVWIKQTGKGTNNYWKEVKQEIQML